MNSIWRSRRLWLRRARLTKMSPMPLRSRRPCSSATSTVTAWIELKAAARSPISSWESTSIGRERLGDGLGLLVLRVPELLDQGGQLLVRERGRGAGQPGERAGDRAGDHHGDAEGDGEAAGAGEQVEHHRAGRGLLLGAGLVDDLLGEGGVDLGEAVEGRGRRGVGVGGGHAELVAVLGALEDLGRHVLVAEGAVGVGDGLLLLRGGAAAAQVLGRTGVALGGLDRPLVGLAVAGDVGAERAGAVGEAAGLGGGDEQGGLLVLGLTELIDAGHGVEATEQVGIVGLTGERRVHAHERADHVAEELGDRVGLAEAAVDRPRARRGCC